ncbi:DegT/DnrJ/EryC1/StrS aminotransferase family protein [Fulvivirgaceae bacterium PWU4]|uniref:DegT/DnrJ/EryC1/StrS aminotransferase family protein n=1 Tax=Chryseosolibacter histidini TaxID=2782349 RepID=A0AAP2DR22_9BACT|nr:DegT/DnrJ/EryC1/StrS aminotransferase family protein [Chryseosolibacter histidini]MBT1700910.1 DegT/DnrJ/EryC1/StrS aminotransferase family protein [Chryseosolibacter histidini]
MKSFIPLSRPNIKEEDIERVAEVLRSGMLVQGEHVKAFENAIAAFIGCKYAIAVSNGTASLHLALKALHIGPGDEVVIPAFSYVATANVVELVGAKPVFVDVELTTCNIQAQAVADLRSPKIKALMPVHEFGLSADIQKLSQIARQNSWALIEDAACALGATEHGKQVGTFKEFGSFSFHPRKAITSGEGGLITTNDDDLANKIYVLRNHGISTQGYLDFIDAGFNYRLTEMQAVLLTGQLKRFDSTLARRKELAALYNERLRGIAQVSLPQYAPEKEHTWQTFHILLDRNIDRAKLILALKDHGVGTNYGAQCIPAMTYYKGKYGFDAEKTYPNAWALYTRGLALPMFETLTDDEIHYICDTLIRLL